MGRGRENSAAGAANGVRAFMARRLSKPSQSLPPAGRSPRTHSVSSDCAVTALATNEQLSLNEISRCADQDDVDQAKL